MRDYWNKKEKDRSKSRLEYFRRYQFEHKKISGKHGVGYSGEIEAMSILKGSERIYKPCDLVWKGKKIDVKTAKFSKTKHGWDFLLIKQKGKVDLFLFLCKDGEGKTVNVFLIPDKDIKTKNFYISAKNFSKYRQYSLLKGGDNGSQKMA